MSQGTLPTGSQGSATSIIDATDPPLLDAPVAPSSILESLPGFREFTARFGVNELRRRFIHMSPAGLPFILWGIPHEDPWGATLINTVLAMAVVIVGMTLYRFQLISRSREEWAMSSVVGYAVPIMAMVFLFPDRAELAMMTLGIVALGDGSATVGGLLIGGRRLPWNHRKTFAGLCSFCLVGTTIATITYWGECQPGVSWSMALAVASISTLAAAFVESLPWSWNDNLRVGTTAAAVGAFVQIVCLGR